MKSVGKLVYSPNSHVGQNKNWSVLMADDEISKYYRSLFYREFPYKGRLLRPIWGAHLSVIRSNEKIPDKLWGKYANKIIEFEYEPGVLDNGAYFWLKASCPVLSDLRESFGLTREPKIGFHLTIGVTP